MMRPVLSLQLLLVTWQGFDLVLHFWHVPENMQFSQLPQDSALALELQLHALEALQGEGRVAQVHLPQGLRQDVLCFAPRLAEQHGGGESTARLQLELKLLCGRAPVHDSVAEGEVGDDIVVASRSDVEGLPQGGPARRRLKRLKRRRRR